MKYPISLDESASEARPSKIDGPRKHYPTLHLHWNERYDLPEDGTMTVKFHKRRETNTEGDDGESQTVELEILTIESVKADKDAPKKSDRDEASDALDRYAAEAGDDDSAYV